MKKWILVLVFCLLPIMAVADGTITTARKMPKLGADGKIERLPNGDGVYIPQIIDAPDGATLYNNSVSYKEPLIENLNDVCFVRWNFQRDIPHTEVFRNCTNLTFVECNLMNVEIPEDAEVIDCLTIHREVKKVGNEIRLIIECGDNKTRTYKVHTENLDLVEADLAEMGIVGEKLTPSLKKAVVDDYIEKGKKTVEIGGNVWEELIDVKDTPSDKSYKHIKRHIR